MKAEGRTIGEMTEARVEQCGPAGWGEFTYVDIGSIDREAKRIVCPRVLASDKAPSRAKQILKAGDVLVSMTRPNLNTVAIVPAALDGSIGSTGFHVLRGKETDPYFLFYAVQTAGFVHAMCQVVQGALYPAVRPKDISSFFLPNFSLAHQRRIVAKIEELFSELDKGIENLKQAKAQLAVYRQALLKHAFEGKLTAEWRVANADRLESGENLLVRIRAEREARYQQQLAEWKKTNEIWQRKKKGSKPKEPLEPKPINSLPRSSESSGITDDWNKVSVGAILIGKPTNGRSVTDRPGGFKVLRLTSLKNGTIELSENKEGDWDESEAEPYVLKRGDFLISRGNGSLRLVGRGGVVKDNQAIAYPDTMVRMVIDPFVFDFRLFCMLWNSDVFRQQIESAARTTAGIYKINQAIISNFCFPIMPLPEQAVIIGILESQLPEIARLEADIDLNLQKAEALRQSILKKAFAGELVPQDPNEEPAAELLKRIRAERTAAAAVPKSKKSSRKSKS